MKDIDEYQKFILTRAGPVDNDQMGLILGALGMGGEAGEFIDLIKKHIFHKHPLDKDRCLKELGDVVWYVSFAAEKLGFKMSEVLEVNRKKLIARYPNGFTVAESLHRKEGQDT